MQCFECSQGNKMLVSSCSMILSFNGILICYHCNPNFDKTAGSHYCASWCNCIIQRMLPNADVLWWNCWCWLLTLCLLAQCRICVVLTPDVVPFLSCIVFGHRLSAEVVRYSRGYVTSISSSVNPVFLQNHSIHISNWPACYFIGWSICWQFYCILNVVTLIPSS